jgi:hypothetical protein
MTYAQSKSEDPPIDPHRLFDKCSGGMTAEGKSGMQEAIDLTSMELPPGAGVSSVEFSSKMLEVIEGFSDQNLKAQLLLRFFDCVEPELKKK